MADKSISDLTLASQINITDRFVIQQGSSVLAVTGQLLLALIEAHGGIKSIVQNADYTLTITYADETTWTSSSIRGAAGTDGVDGIYPIVSSLAWNSEMRAGTLDPEITLPTPPSTTTAELRYIFMASTTTASFTAPDDYILGTEEGFAGLSAGNTITYETTAGSIYECSFIVLDGTHIGMILKEWATA